MKRYNVVLEGIDGSGKTSLARRIMEEFPTDSRLLRMGIKRPESRQDMLVRLAQCRSEASIDKINIFDRFSAISEAVYRDNGGLTFGQVLQEIEDCHIDLIVWANPPFERLRIVPSEDPRDVEYTQKVKHRLAMLCQRYEELMKEIWKHQEPGGYKCLHYDYSQVSTRVLQGVCQHISEGA